MPSCKICQFLFYSAKRAKRRVFMCYAVIIRLPPPAQRRKPRLFQKCRKTQLQALAHGRKRNIPQYARKFFTGEFAVYRARILHLPVIAKALCRRSPASGTVRFYRDAVRFKHIAVRSKHFLPRL